MIDIFEYENKNVIIKCVDGRTFKGRVEWCERAVDIDEDEDVLAIENIGLLVSEIESINVIH